MQDSETNASYDFYRAVMQRLSAAGIPFLVGGSVALSQYMRLGRPSKDLDLFAMREHTDALLAEAEQAGYRTEITSRHWLAKIYDRDDNFIDVVFNSGNGICVVDASWFEHGVPGAALGLEVKFCAPEELIWSKAYIMERERYDGADINHLVRACGSTIDWRRLLTRFGPHWPVLLSHLVLFLFVYPSERAAIPDWLLADLLERTRVEAKKISADAVCNGTLLSRSQYRIDVESWGYRDARLPPSGGMSAKEAASWTRAAGSS
ncbi:MAG TPA: nucleotidyltransferase [Candidatus Acidoferrales bacterium]|nr:nucleotidyltransferase [Candidatus Acidoferrales bacterium]